MVQCRAKTKYGYPCRASAVRGSAMCLFHTQQASVKAKANRSKRRKK